MLSRATGAAGFQLLLVMTTSLEPSSGRGDLDNDQ